MLRNKKAFTLVELLVVVAVISVLAAMLLPTLEQSLRSARRVYCANNLRQMGASIHLYANESRGFLPPPHQRTVQVAHPHVVGSQNFFDGSTVFSRALEPYTGFRNHRDTSTILNCPDTPSQQIYYWTGNYIAPYSYMGNIKIWGPKRITDAQSNSRRSILMADTNYTNKNWWAMYNHGNVSDPAPAFYAQQKGVAFRPSGVNIVYIDGAVSWIAMDQIDMNVYYRNIDKYTMYWTE